MKKKANSLPPKPEAKPAFKPISVEDFDLSPEQLKQLVEGAQKFLPPEAEPKKKENQ